GRNVIEIPAPRRPLASANTTARSETAALGKTRRLHPKSKPSEIVRFTRGKRALISQSHSLSQPVFVHSAAIIGNCDDRTPAVPMEIDPDVARSSGNAVIYEISQSGRQFIAECAETFRETCRFWRDVIVKRTFCPFVGVDLEWTHAGTRAISIPL